MMIHIIFVYHRSVHSAKLKIYKANPVKPKSLNHIKFYAFTSICIVYILHYFGRKILKLDIMRAIFVCVQILFSSLFLCACCISCRWFFSARQPKNENHGTGKIIAVGCIRGKSHRAIKSYQFFFSYFLRVQALSTIASPKHTLHFI